MTPDRRKISRFELLMDAGFGAQKAGDILIKAFAAMGKNVFIEPMIPAEISPPARTGFALSGVIIRVAEMEINDVGSDTDLILAAHEVVLNRRLDDQETNPRCQVLLDMVDKEANLEAYEKVCRRVTDLGLNIIPFELDDDSKAIMRTMSGAGKNMFYLGMLAHIYSADVDIVAKEIKKAFPNIDEIALQKNAALFKNGYRYAKEHIFLSYEVAGTPQSTEKILIDGNSALAMGVVDAGIKLFAGYPITPASSIMHTLAKVFPAYGGIVHQAEDEISAIGAAVGSYFGGVPAITATSGPGLSLKQEFIGFAMAAEIPLIVVDVQRAGPSTGMPTKTEQSDLLAVLFGSHGDSAKIVISVANVIDCFYAPHLARYLTEKLKIPVFIMSDFQTANSYKVVNKLKITQMNAVDEIADLILERFYINRLSGDFPTIRDNQAIPGTPDGMKRVTGLNTDSAGRVSYFAGTHQRSHEIRNEKVHIVQRALKKPEMFGPEEGDLLVVGWGSAKGAIDEGVNLCRAEGLQASGLHLKIVYPFPLMLKEIFSRFKRVVTVEVAYGDSLKPSPLAMLLRAFTLADVQPAIARATGRPLTPKGVAAKIRELLK